ncbi:hypothetical protein CR513_35226, partial [Mucuna pruriens]
MIDFEQIEGGGFYPAPLHEIPRGKEGRCHQGEPKSSSLIGPYRTKRTKIGTALDEEIKEQLICFLTEIRNIFAWTLRDMPRIDLNFLLKEEDD